MFTIFESTPLEISGNTVLSLSVILAITMIILGIKTKMRIFNLLSVAPLTYITILFADFSLALVVLGIGLIFFNVYYALLGRYDWCI